MNSAIIKCLCVPFSGKTKTLLLATIFWIAYSPIAHTATYYVDNSVSSECSDSSTFGTEVNPWCSISYSLSKLTAGDTVLVKSGTYNENLYISNLTGTENNPIAIQAYPGHVVILYGNGVNTGRCKITECSYLVFDGFTVTNYNQGLFVEGASSFITINNCVIHNVGQEALHIKENSSFILVDSCEIYNTRQWNYNGEGVYIGTGSAGPVDNTHHITVLNSIIHDVTDEAVELKPGTHDCIVSGNTIYNAASGQNWGAIEINQHSLGVQYYGQDPNHIVKNNTIYNVGTAIRAGTGCKVYNNLIYNVNAGCYGIYVNNLADDNYNRYIYHNTIDLSTSNAFRVDSDQAIIKNNIGPSLENNMLTNDSFFVSTVEGSKDYHLVKGSPAVDSVVDVIEFVSYDLDNNERPIGVTPDFGAYEYIHESVFPAQPKNLRVVE